MGQVISQTLTNVVDVRGIQLFECYRKFGCYVQDSGANNFLKSIFKQRSPDFVLIQELDPMNKNCKKDVSESLDTHVFARLLSQYKNPNYSPQFQKSGKSVNGKRSLSFFLKQKRPAFYSLSTKLIRK